MVRSQKREKESNPIAVNLGNEDKVLVVKRAQARKEVEEERLQAARKEYAV